MDSYEGCAAQFDAAQQDLVRQCAFNIEMPHRIRVVFTIDSLNPRQTHMQAHEGAHAEEETPTGVPLPEIAGAASPGRVTVKVVRCQVRTIYL